MRWTSLNMHTPTPEGENNFEASEHCKIERFSSGFIVSVNGYNDWIPDARVNRARFELVNLPPQKETPE